MDEMKKESLRDDKMYQQISVDLDADYVDQFRKGMQEKRDKIFSKAYKEFETTEMLVSLV